MSACRKESKRRVVGLFVASVGAAAIAAAVVALRVSKPARPPRRIAMALKLPPPMFNKAEFLQKEEEWAHVRDAANAVARIHPPVLDDMRRFNITHVRSSDTMKMIRILEHFP
jgi:hypothetical protein